jgi:polyisoprenoid-binding protein YceI
MTTQHFQWTIVCLLVGVTVVLGLVGFLVWNQQVEPERPLAGDMSNQLEMGGSEEPSEEKPDSGPAEGAPTYQVDTAASRVFVKVGSATRLGHPHGVEGALKSGSISLGGQGELVFDMTSFKADTPEARKKVGLEGKKMSENEAKKVNVTMRSADVLDIDRFPTATYKITALKPANKQAAGAPGMYQAEGRFTLHGAEKPLQFKARVERTNKEGILKLTGSFTIKQTDHGMTPYSAAGGLAKVADELQISGELLLRPAR